jgi:hypothetical protein
MKNIGILLDTEKEEQVDFANRLIDLIKSSGENIDIVIFYESAKRMKKQFATSTLSMEHIWSFGGTLITLSATNLSHVINIPLEINHVYIPDYDLLLNPLSLLLTKEKFKIICLSNVSMNNMNRTIGSNIETKLSDNFKNILKEIS